MLVLLYPMPRSLSTIDRSIQINKIGGKKSNKISPRNESRNDSYKQYLRKRNEMNKTPNTPNTPNTSTEANIVAKVISLSPKKTRRRSLQGFTHKSSKSRNSGFREPTDINKIEQQINELTDKISKKDHKPDDKPDDKPEKLPEKPPEKQPEKLPEKPPEKPPEEQPEKKKSMKTRGKHIRRTRQRTRGRKVRVNKKTMTKEDLENIEKKIQSIRNKKSKDIKESLEKDGIKVSGKSDRLLKDIYFYSKVCNINIQHEV
jgi:hypothetical protein